MSPITLAYMPSSGSSEDNNETKKPAIAKGRVRRSTATRDNVKVESPLPGAALMFEDFAALVHDASLRKRWMRASERTQALLDACWDEALRSTSRSS